MQPLEWSETARIINQQEIYEFQYLFLVTNLTEKYAAAEQISTGMSPEEGSRKD